MKKYEFSMSTGSNSSTHAILENIAFFKNGVLRATKIASVDGFAEDGSFIYKSCIHREFIAGGGPYTLEEYLGPIEPGEREEAVEKIKKSIAPL